MPRHLPSNSFERIAFAVSGVDVITSVRLNLDEEKVQLAVREALSLWSSVTPLSFEPSRVGEEPLLRIHFESKNWATPTVLSRARQPALSARPASTSTPTTSSSWIGSWSPFRFLSTVDPST
jgi:hypothetical protein